MRIARGSVLAMRVFTIASTVAVCLLLYSCAGERGSTAGGTGSQEELIEAIRTAIQQKDVEAITALTDWENVPERTQEAMRQHIPNCFRYNEPRFTFREMTAEERQPAQAGGATYAWNMETVGYVVIEGSDPASGSTSIPIGVRDGRYYVASRYPTN